MPWKGNKLGAERIIVLLASTSLLGVRVDILAIYYIPDWSKKLVTVVSDE